MGDVCITEEFIVVVTEGVVVTDDVRMTGELTVVETDGAGDKLIVRNGEKGEFLEGLFDGEEGGDFIGDFGVGLVRLSLSRGDKLRCVGLLYC